MRKAALILLGSVLAAGCARLSTENPPIEIFPDMKRQPKFKPQSANEWLAERGITLRPVPGTVAVGHLDQDEAFYTGAKNGLYVGRNPLPIDMETLKRGQERFNIYCAPCHDRTGSGRGIVGSRSMWLANNLHDQRIKDMVDGEIFQVITYGRRTMPSYRFQIPPRDRWAIVAYVRALQRTTSGTIEDVPADLRRELR